MILIGSMLTAQAQVTGFNLEWNFCDANGGNQVFHQQACEGDYLYLINKSRKGVFSIGMNGTPIVNGDVTYGEYHFWVGSTQIKVIPANQWQYGDTVSVLANFQVLSTGINCEVRYVKPSSNGGIPGAAYGSFIGWNYEDGRLDVFPAMNVTASQDVIICQGDQVTLSATGANTYQWDNGAGSGSSVSVSPSQTTTYTVTGYNNIGCSASDQVTVTVIQPQINIPDQTMCNGVGSQICPTGFGPSTWWYKDEGLQLTYLSNGPCFTPTSPGNYYVAAYIQSTAGHFCYTSGTFTVTELAGHLNAAFDIETIHKGSYYSIRATALQSAFPAISQNPHFWWQVEDLTNGCVGQNYQEWWGSTYGNANGFLNDFPEYDPVTCIKNTSYIHGHFLYGHTYKISRAVWSDCDDWCTATATVSLDMNPYGCAPRPTTEGVLDQEISGSRAEDAESRRIELLDQLWEKHGTPPGEEPQKRLETEKLQEEENKMVVYPNPTTGIFNIDFKGNSGTESKVDVMDASGRIVWQSNSVKNAMQVDLTKESSGLYMIRWFNGESTTETKVIVE